MRAFETMTSMGHEQVVFCRNDEVGLRAIIAIHDTTLGPALGGCRFYDYATEEEALRDVLRLSRGMTYKAAVAGLDLGGGKAVIMGDPSIKSEALFRAFGRFVSSLGGRYITAEDMNTNVEDMDNIRRESPHVTGAGTHLGGAGDPSPVTAWGVFHSIRASLEVVYGSADLSGRSVAIQGVGNVGYNLSKYLSEAGAKVIVSDINRGHIERCVAEFGATVAEGDAYFSTPCDVLAPCAIGGIINPRTIGEVKAPILCGGANNILEDEARESAMLLERGITYAPDYVANAGGLMHVYAEMNGWEQSKAMADAEGIFNTVKRILHRANSEGISTTEASNQIAEDRIESVGRLKRFHLS